MSTFADIVLSDPSGTAIPLSNYRGSPVLIQVVRYYG